MAGSAFTRLTDEVIDQLERSVLAFASNEEAAAAAGIGRTTFYRWQARGREVAKAAQEEGAPEPSADDLLYVRLVDKLDLARVAAKANALAAIQRAGIGELVTITKTVTTENKDGSITTRTETIERVEKSWTAYAWLLERKFPREYALVNRTELTGADGGPVKVEGDLEAMKARAVQLVGQVALQRARRARAVDLAAEAGHSQGNGTHG